MAETTVHLSTPNDADEPCLTVRNLNAGYHGRPVVQNINLHLCTGEFVGLVGHNGSGKSTVLMGIAGLTWATAEAVVLLNHQLAEASPCARTRHGLGILLQRDGLFPDLSVQTNMALAGVPHEYPTFFPQANELRETLEPIMRRRSQRAGSLSGGERRLLSLALSLARRPSIILADEPTLGLTDSLELAVMRYLRHLASIENRAVLVVSHNLPLVESLCSRSYVIERGEMRCEWRRGGQGETLVQQVQGSI